MQDVGVSSDEQAALQELSQVMCVRSAVLSLRAGGLWSVLSHHAACASRLRLSGSSSARLRGCRCCCGLPALARAVLRYVAAAAAAERHLLP
jgi:hypothetical protein